MIIAVCATWARVKQVITQDAWVTGMLLAVAELMIEFGLILAMKLAG